MESSSARLPEVHLASNSSTAKTPAARHWHGWFGFEDDAGIEADDCGVGGVAVGVTSQR